MFVVAFVMDRVAARLPEMLATITARHQCIAAATATVAEWGCTIKTTVSVDVNINSPQMGQSHSVDRSMHR